MLSSCCCSCRSVLRGRKLPLWITGHSLGGGYASALFLHLLTLKNELRSLFPVGALQHVRHSLAAELRLHAECTAAQTGAA